MKNKESLPHMDGHGTFIQKLLDVRSDLPKKQKQVCDYMIEHHQSIGVLTLSELADQANVGTTTVMRLINNLGYESYLDVKKDIFDASMQTTSSAWWHLQKSFTTTNQQDHTILEVLSEVKSILDQTVTPSLISNFDTAIQLLLNSKRVNILGVRTNKALATYFGYLLQEFFHKVTQLSDETEFIFDRLLRMEKGELLILFDNSPFTTVGIEAAKYCHENGHSVILITDHLSSPATDYSTVVLNTAASSKQYSVVPTLFTIESLIIEIGRKTSRQSIADLEKLSSLLERKNITQPFSFDQKEES
ncbi:MurR/RpiR family transcriptional regulator [Oceanobacillus sp. FSL K6-2867]|uniref:MurR/RpiR family transcriptional regulator n=1 Tax=Oceanobacillus sp. FSL K6-2867 TaxID=2954748 RepID=UPI0030DA2DB3